MKVLFFLTTFIAIGNIKLVLNQRFQENIEIRERVINGRNAKPHEAPYIVSLTNQISGQHFCSGSIIAKQWILTAAHCIFGGSIYVHAGLHDRTVRNGQTVKVDKTYIHEKYSKVTFPYDIGILHLEKPLNLNNHVRAIALPKTKKQRRGICTLFGWGLNDPFKKGIPNILQTVTTDLIPFTDCAAKLPKGSSIHPTNICSGSRKKHISACNGDSGGPLITKKRNKTILVGIVSWTIAPCGEHNFPSVYTHTGSYLKWIKKILAS